jgi:hypothetical protein
MAWNRIRRQITRDLDTEIMNNREDVLNILLAKAFDDFVDAVQSGEVKQVESRYTDLVKNVVRDLVPAAEEATIKEPQPLHPAPPYDPAA